MLRLLASSAAVCLLLSPVLADDLPATSGAIASVASHDWTGFHIGINGGFGRVFDTGSTFCVTPGGVVDGSGCTTIVPDEDLLSPSSWLFGGQVGYDWQIDRWTLGVEADFQGTDASDSVFISPLTSPGSSFAASYRMEGFGTVRGRLGASFDRVLIYATGGMFVGSVEVSQLLSFPETGTFYPAASDDLRTGWTAGGGLEVALSSNWSGKVEGLYYDLGSETIGFSHPGTGFTRSTTFDNARVIVRGGINYKFGVP